MKLLITLLISGLTYIIYNYFIIKKYGIPKSISDTYYLLPEDNRWIFHVVIWLIIIPLIVASDEYYYMPLAIGLVGVVSAASDFMTTNVTKIVHFSGAIGGIVWGMFLVWFELNLPIVSILGGIGILISAIFLKQGKLWFIETIALLTIYSALIIIKLR